MILGIVDSASRPVAGFTDTFTGSGTLDPRWSDVRGSWSRVSDKANTATAASTYPITVFNANTYSFTVRGENNVAETGWGVAFWVQDENNWWGFANYRSSGYACNPGDSLSGTTCTTPVTTSTSTVCDATTYSCPAGYAYFNNDPNNPTCYNTGCSAGTSYDNASCCFGATPCRLNNSVDCRCSSFVITSTTPATATTNCYPVTVTSGGDTYTATLGIQYKVRLLRNVNGVVSEITGYTVQNTTSSSEYFSVMQVSASKTGVLTLTAQMGNGTTSTVTNTPVSPNRRRKAGLLLNSAGEGTQAQSVNTFVYSPV